MTFIILILCVSDSNVQIKLNVLLIHIYKIELFIIFIINFYYLLIAILNKEILLPTRADSPPASPPMHH